MSKTTAHARATFSHMEQGTREDWAAISAEFMPFAQALADRVLDHLKLLDGDYGGFPIDRLTHCLQTATLAHRDGRDEEYVVCALLHDIGDTLGTFNHPDIAAAILKPFVSPENLWMVEKHGVFQGYYFFHHLGLDRNLREQFRSQPELFERTAEFCAKYDGAAFMRDYDTLPLSFFEPMVRRVFARPRNSMYVKENESTLAQPG
ncbi:MULTISPECIES: HD domain-containing protein [Cupriavidus]|uniref:HD domain-containing protein n=1 Tax=Cupriavidus TaxID=106589 RepID=UPI0004502D71|nr:MULTISPECIES: HD domain-containing protein [Cupriavidus]KDP88203.1 phosphohydrolase [Cupriavidus sp. SK-3]MDF3880935.1 HD domain-containing protein [Cupriavidus basilensis]